MSEESREPTVTNVIIPFIKEEIITSLAAYPFYPHQQAFKEENLQLKLLAYVLNRVPGLYIVVDAAFNLNSYAISSQRMLDIETVIHQGIQELVPTPKVNQPSLKEYYEHHQFIKVS